VGDNKALTTSTTSAKKNKLQRLIDTREESFFEQASLFLSAYPRTLLALAADSSLPIQRSTTAVVLMFPAVPPASREALLVG